MRMPLENDSILGQRRDNERGMIPKQFRGGDKLGPIAFEHCFDRSRVAREEPVFFGHHEDDALRTAQRDGIRIRSKVEVETLSRACRLDE